MSATVTTGLVALSGMVIGLIMGLLERLYPPEKD
jgi:predicted membrane metal-binding protein